MDLHGNLVCTIDILPRLSKTEILPGILFQGILVGGQPVDLVIHILDLLSILLDEPVLTADLRTGPDPADDVVLVDETNENQEDHSGNDGITDE